MKQKRAPVDRPSLISSLLCPPGALNGQIELGSQQLAKKRCWKEGREEGRREGRREQHNYCTPLLITGPVQTLVACLTAHLRYRTFNDLWCSYRSSGIADSVPRSLSLLCLCFLRDFRKLFPSRGRGRPSNVLFQWVFLMQLSS